MKTINGIILLIALMASQISYTQRAKDGDYIASTADNIVNSYTFLTSDAALGTNSILVDDNAMIGGVFTNDLAAGDLILIIQMQGADIAVSTGTVDNGFGNYTVPPFPQYDFWNQSDWRNYIDIWGGISSYNNAGKFEKVEVLSVTGSNTILLQCNLKNDYSESGKVQVVRIPRFDNLTVNGGLNSIIPELWDGQIGGIVAIEVDTELNVATNSSISASEFGFRGGEVDPVGITGIASGYDNVSFLGTSDPAEGSEKGEGIFGFHTELDLIYSRYGISGAANGGGGAGYTNAGGGGGSNIGTGTYTGDGIPQDIATFGAPLNFVPIWNLETPPIGGVISSGGGRGGYTIASNDLDETVFGPRDPLWGDDGRRNNGGRGGHPLTYDISRTFFGGGGGAGDQDSDQAGSGGRGGGIVFITSYGSIVGDGIIEVNGQDGQNSNPLDLPVGGGATRRGNDGAGGGGAAGSILIENIAPIPATIKLNAFGGDGGNQNLQYSSLSLNREAGGPGGAGAGGSISYSSGTPTQNLLGGTAGVTNSPFVENFNVNGATGGANGIGNFIIPVFDLATTDAIICTNSSVDLTATVTGSLPVGSDVEWYDQEFGGTSIWTGTTYTTPLLTATTTYYVTVCPGSFRIPVTVTITLVDDPTFISTDFCAATTNAISSVATSGGVFTIASQTGSNAVTIDSGTGILSNYVAGDQVTIQYTTPAGGCQNSSTQVVNVTGLDDATFASADFCSSTTNTISSVATSGGVYTIASQTGSNTVTIDGGTGILSNYVAGDQVTIQYTTPAGGCQNSSTQVVNVTGLDDATFASSDFCSSTTNTISSVVTSGGVYTIASQTGSNAVTIDSGTGILSNYAVGDQVTIQYTTPAGGCQNSSTQVVNVTGLDDATFASSDFCSSTTNTISSVVTSGGVYTIASQTGSNAVTIDSGTGILSNYVAGDQVTIQYTTPAGGCQNSSTQVVNVTALDDATFASSDFCSSTTNTISSVATSGGVYTIASQTGSNAVTIDGGTGILSNYVAGDQVTIQYTTPAGGCQNSSTQVVNVTGLDDATFVSSDFCSSTTNSISSVATSGGVYTIASQTGSNAVTIDGGTGILSNYVAGDQVTIQYTTPAGGCQNSSTQVVNVTGLDDATFASADFCSSTTNTISSVATSGGVYTIASQTGSNAVTIDGGTGILSNYVAGDQVTIQYTTPAGGCQNSSTQVVNVTGLDDATFASADFCSSTINTISSVATSGGVYTIASQTGSNAVTIDSGTGILSNYVAGDQVTIQYTTPAGGCQNSSTQVVSVTGLDDATFASADFCEASVNTITSVATVGGAYSIASQTGSGLVTIDGVTGILSNFTAGDQVTIQYTTPVGGCQNSSTQVVNVTNLDDASFASIDFCESSVNEISSVVTAGGVFAISNQTGSGSVTINAVTGILTNYSAGDQISIEYTTPAGACQNSAIQVVNVVGNPVLIISDPAPICEPDGVDLTVSSVTAGSDTGSLTYWSDASATTSLINANNITSGSVYYVQLENSIGCQSIAPVNVLFNTAPILNLFSSGGVYCSGDFIVDLSVDVTGVADYTLEYTLDGVAQTVTSTTNSINIGSAEGIYVLTSLSDANCLISLNETQEIVINTIPNAPVVTPDAIYCEGVEMSELIATGSGGVFTWYSDMALSSVISNGSSLSPFLSLGQTNYYVTESNNGCEGAPSAVSITIENCEITIPTAFTPDGDLTNDTWEILDIDATYPDNIVRVFNRWGNNIFTSIQGEYNNKRWDGTYEGKILPVGSYYFIIDYNKEGKENEKGVVSIILNK